VTVLTGACQPGFTSNAPAPTYFCFGCDSAANLLVSCCCFLSATGFRPTLVLDPPVTVFLALVVLSWVLLDHVYKLFGEMPVRL
jgi:hypothetical protein